MDMTFTVDQDGYIRIVPQNSLGLQTGDHLCRLFEISNDYDYGQGVDWFEIIKTRIDLETAITLKNQSLPSQLTITRLKSDQFQVEISELPLSNDVELTNPSHFSDLFETSDSCFYIRGMNGQLRTVLGSTAHRPHVPEPIQAGQSVFDLYEPAALKKLLQTDAMMESTRRPAQTKDTLMDSTGKRVFQSAKSPLYDSSGKLLGISGLTHEITEYQDSLDQINFARASATRSMMSSSLAMIILRLEDKKILSVNDSFISHFGYEKASVIGSTPLEICLLDINSQNQLERQVVEKGEIAGHKMVFRSKSNVPIKVEISAYVMEVDGERCLVSLILDQSRAETAETRLKLIADASFEGIALHNEGIIIEINQTGCEILGRTREELIGTSGLDLLQPSDQVSAQKTWEGDRLASYEIPISRPDQSQRVIEVRSYQVIEKGHHHRIAVFHDITAEKELKEQLNRTQKMEILGQLTGGIAHDFNNILASILGFSELSVEMLSSETGGDPKKLLHWARQVHKSGIRGRDLVRQMLSFSRGGSAQPVTISPGKPIEEVLSMVRASIPSHIDAEAEIGATSPIFIDPIQLNQILLNLCLNASHAIGDDVGSITVSVSERGVSQEQCSSCQQQFSGDFVVVSVTDTGSGIDPKNIRKIFEPFFSTKEVNQGTGMGLAMIHGIVHDCHGHIMVSSELGSGACFSIALPPRQQAVSLITNQKDDNAKTIVLVDDDELVADMVYRVLKQQGYHVQSFNSPLAALTEFDASGEGWDLLITDQKMPDLTGVELIQKIHQKRQDLPVILHTGYRHDIQSPTDATNWVVLEKPVEQKRLLRTIDNLLTTGINDH